MKLLPESNGVYRLNMKREFKPLDIIKIVAIALVGILLFGFLYQSIWKFSVKEKLNCRYDYTRVNDRRMDYLIEGSGDYTVVFDGDIGGDITQWLKVTKELNDENIRTFVYNRQGYGYNDSGAILSPKEQAENLKILLRKAGLSGKFILVGEGYGSLVMTNFAATYPDSVEGMVLINPIDESTLGSKEIKKEYFTVKIRRKVEELGSYIGLTRLLDKLGLDVDLNEYENKIPEIFKDEFEAHRSMSPYTSAVYNEITNLINGQSDSQSENLLQDKPLYLLVKDKNTPLTKIAKTENTYIYETTVDSDFMALDDKDSVISAVKHVVKELNLKKRENRG